MGYANRLMRGGDVGSISQGVRKGFIEVQKNRFVASSFITRGTVPMRV